MTGFNKLFSSIVTSSLWSEDDQTVRVWITLLALKDASGIVEGSVPGLARIANVPRDHFEKALAKFASPDPDSRDLDRHPEREGRRIEKVPGGWRILNHDFYRDLQVGREFSMSAEAVKKRRQRAMRGHPGTSGDTDGTVTAEVGTLYASASDYGSDSAPEDQEVENAVGREGLGAVAEFMAKHEFGKFAPIVEGYLRSQRSAVAVMATFEMHLTGEMDHEKATPAQMGLAIQQYSANEGSQRFSARYFAGFVRDVKKQVERGGRRKTNANEQQHIDREAEERRERQREEREGKLIAFAEREHPQRLVELRRIADTHVPKKFSSEVRENMVHGSLIDLIRKEWPDTR